MASPVLSSPNPIIISGFSIQTSFFSKTSQLSLNKKIKKPHYSVPNKVVPCKAMNNGNQNPTPSSRKTNETTYSCPPTTTKIIDFKLPSFSKLRYRRPAHLVDADYVAEFTKAVNLMKDLPPDDPRSFMQQANVYRAYRNGAYDQVGFPDQDLQIHFSSLFVPFHRLYLYFYERILGKLIGDPDIAMPFWNWDAPAGMSIPAIFVNPQSPLYDDKRNVSHQPPKLVDLDYNGTDKEITDKELVLSNLKVMYRQMVSGAKTASLFHGKVYRAGDKPSPGAGSIEAGSHTAIQVWVGDQRQEYKEDMGNFYSSGRDVMFYGLHANVDRLWSVWENIQGTGHFSDIEYLNAAFYFYDENANLVRAKVRDCLDTKTLGYDYEPVELPWLTTKPVRQKFGKQGGRAHGHAMAAEIKNKNIIRNVFPIVLDKTVSIEIPRPRKSRSKREKEEEEEVLVLERIQLERDASVKFDVYINVEDEEAPSGPEDAEFAGSFTNIPHNHKHAKKLETSFSLAISDLLEDLEVEGDDNIVVTLVLRRGKGLVTVGNIKIDYIRE